MATIRFECGPGHSEFTATQFHVEDTKGAKHLIEFVSKPDGDDRLRAEFERLLGAHSTQVS